MAATALLACLAWGIPLLGIVEVELSRRRLAGHSKIGESYRIPPAPVLRALSFGYTELAADALWLRTITYFTDHLRGDGELPHLKRYLDATLALDQRFKAIYRYGNAMLMSREGIGRTNDDVLAAIALLKRAHELFPDDPNFPMLVGAYYIMELRTSSPTKRRAWRRRGADSVPRAAIMRSDMPWLANLAAKIYSEQGQRELAIRSLKEIYVVTPDPKTKAQIAARLKNLQDHQLNELRIEAKKFAEAHRQSRLRFVPADLYALLRQEPLAPFSL